MLKTRLFKALATDTRGAAAIEYVVLSSCIAVAIVGAVTSAGSNVSSTLNKINMDGDQAAAVSNPVAIRQPIFRPMPVSISPVDTVSVDTVSVDSVAVTTGRMVSTVSADLVAAESVSMVSEAAER